MPAGISPVLVGILSRALFPQHQHPWTPLLPSCRQAIDCRICLLQPWVVCRRSKDHGDHCDDHWTNDRHMLLKDIHTSFWFDKNGVAFCLAWLNLAELTCMQLFWILGLPLATPLISKELLVELRILVHACGPWQRGRDCFLGRRGIHTMERSMLPGPIRVNRCDARSGLLVNW